jgi:hypothetical protein
MKSVFKNAGGITLGFLASFALGPKIKAAIVQPDADHAVPTLAQKPSKMTDSTLVQEALKKHSAEVAKTGIFAMNESGDIEVLGTRAELESMKIDLAKTILEKSLSHVATPTTEV